jgi:hypothetical protein
MNPWASSGLAKLPLLGGLKQVDLQMFSGLLVAAVVITVGAMAVGWLWSIWDRHAIAGFFQRHRTPSPGRPGRVAAGLRVAPTVAFSLLAGLLVAGTAAVAQRYGGRLVAVGRLPGPGSVHRRPAVKRCRPVSAHPRGAGLDPDRPEDGARRGQRELRESTARATG